MGDLAKRLERVREATAHYAATGNPSWLYATVPALAEALADALGEPEERQRGVRGRDLVRHGRTAKAHLNGRRGVRE